MQIYRKTFVFEGLKNINVDFIEKFIQKSGFDPLRWAVVEVNDENKFVVEAVVVK